MNGIFGYDGYAYQNNICMRLILEKFLASNGGNLLECRFEISKPEEKDGRKNEFTVDLILISNPEEKGLLIEIIEVKGGDNISDELLESSRINLEKCTAEILKEYPKYLSLLRVIKTRVGQSLLRPSKDGLGDIATSPEKEEMVGILPYSKIDLENIEMIRKIISRKVDREIDLNSKRIFFSLKHLIDFYIRKKAWLTRNAPKDKNLKQCVLTPKEIFEFEGSFSDVLHHFINNPDKSRATTLLSNYNKNGMDNTSDIEFKGEKSPSLDPGLNV